MKTYSIKKSEIKRDWYLIDAKNKVLGRVATTAANLLRGKHKVSFTPNQDAGDFVVIINASKVRFTGKKLEQKKYIRHTGYPGGLRSKTLKELIKENPTEPLKRATLGMIPANRLKKEIAKRLKIYTLDKHKHTQKLNKYKID